jgi:hypothetical protein
MNRAILAALLLALAAGCSADVADDSKLTRAQRDSVIAKSVLPGAGVVGRAIEVSAGASQRSADLDSLAN